jgi:hypothetical protein
VHTEYYLSLDIFFLPQQKKEQSKGTGTLPAAGYQTLRCVCLLNVTFRNDGKFEPAVLQAETRGCAATLTCPVSILLTCPVSILLCRSTLTCNNKTKQ